MRTCTTAAKSAALIGVVSSSAFALNIAVASADQGGTIVGLQANLRNCDFSLVHYPPLETEVALGTGSVRIHKSGSSVVAEVSLADSPSPNTHFDVGLIQEPRPSSAGCGPGAPGTAFVGLQTDPAGVGTVTVQDTLRPGTKGVWVIVERPSPHLQDPAEYYTSEFLVPT